MHYWTVIWSIRASFAIVTGTINVFLYGIVSVSKLSLKSLFLIQQSVKNSSKEEVSVSKDKEREGVFVEPLY